MTWLPKLLMGDEQCEWKAWFRIYHEQFDRVPDDFNRTVWQIEHTTLEKDICGRLKAGGYNIWLENQNMFRLPAKGGSTIAGKPDIVAVKNNKGLVCDAKSGQVRSSDNAQVMIYLWALNMSHRFPGVDFNGQVVYRDRVIDIPGEAVNDSFIASLFALLRRVSAKDPPSKVPSMMECRYCQIARSECPERMEDGPDAGVTE